MGKIFIFVLLALISLISTAPGLAAGVRPGAFTLSVIGDGYSFDGKQHLQTMPVIGVRGGYNFTKRLRVEGLMDYVRTTSTVPGPGDATVVRYGGELLLHLADTPLTPYLAAGYGAVAIDREYGGSSTRGIGSYGLGLLYFVTDNIAMRGDLRHLLLWSGEMLSNYEYTVGFTWQFGGRKPAPPPPPPPPVMQPEPVPPPPPEPEPVQPQEPPPEPAPPTEPAQGHFKYCIPLKVEFDIDRADIRPEFHDEIARVGNFMEQFPTTTAVIAGHTDNVGSADHNLKLSKLRADKVVEYLVEQFGIDRGRLTAQAFGPAQPVTDNSTDVAKQKNRRMEAIIDCAVTPEQMKPEERLCLSLNIEFATGSADIDPKYNEEIGRVADYLKRYATATALIEGHTDNVGGFRYNMLLSEKRAKAVVDYLVEKFRVDRSRLLAKGYGYTRRIAYNSTPEGRQKNRRINAVIDCVVGK